MANLIEKEQFSQFTNNVKKILVYGVNRNNPQEYFSISYNDFVECVKVEKGELNGILDYMRNSGLLTRESSNTLPTLTSRGINMGQDISRNNYWDKAVVLCEQNELYSLDSIMYTVRLLTQKSIIEKMNVNLENK